MISVSLILSAVPAVIPISVILEAMPIPGSTALSLLSVIADLRFIREF